MNAEVALQPFLNDLAIALFDSLPAKKERLSESAKKTRAASYLSLTAARDRLFADLLITESLFDSGPLSPHGRDRAAVEARGIG